MQDSKLTHLLTLLNKQEIKRFTAYLASPYYNKKEDVQALATALIKRFVSGSKGGEEEDVFKDVYGKEAFHSSRFNNLKTALQNLLLDFLSLRAYETDPAAKNYYLIKKLNESEDEKHFPGYYKKAIQHLDQSDLSEPELYQEKFKLEQAFNKFHTRSPQRDGQDHLQAAIDHLGDVFVVRMYQFIIQNQDRKAILGVSVEIPWADQIIQYVEHRGENLPSIIHGYHALYQMRSAGDSEPKFNSMREWLATYAGELSHPEALYLYTGTLNYAARRLNDGNLDFLPVVYELYREMLDQEVVLEKGKISSWHFKNIVNVALRSKDFEWTRSFLEQNRNLVQQDYNYNLIEFSKGLLHFYSQEYEAAERQFNWVLNGYKDVFYGIDSRAFLLQIYYETGNSLGLETLAHSFRMFLDRNKGISPTKRNQYVSFILHLKRLSNIPLRDKERLKQLKNDILDKSVKGMGTRWLLSKIEELEADAGC